MGIILAKAKNKSIFAFRLPSCYLNKGKYIGNKLDDFEILQMMGKGAFGFVAKVKSKINSEIYALKKNEKERMNKIEKERFQNEILFMQYFDHPNVCKCLTTFEEDGDYYYVMKLFNNKDLYRYLNAYKQLKIKINEEVLWDIFNQCLNGLLYIHNQGVIHRDIKLGNIFMDDKGNIQIGDFGISLVLDKTQVNKFTKDQRERENLLLKRFEQAGSPGFMAPEVLKGDKYDQKADVFSMGIIFYTLCFSCLPYEEIYMLHLNNDNYYSLELKNIISLMIKEDQNNRPNSSDINKLFQKMYIKKHVKNTGIYCVVKCLFNFPNYTNYFQNKNKISKIMETKYLKEVSLMMISIISSINDTKGLAEEIYFLRKMLYTQGIHKKDNIEITPSEAVNIIINSLNYELNEIAPKVNSDSYLHVDASFGDENVKYQEFKKNNKKYFQSLISKNFVGALKIKRLCKKCNQHFFKFEKFHYISFNINIFDNDPITIYDCFDYFNKIEKNIDLNDFSSCPYCKERTEQIENKTFYNTNKNLIIMFERGENNENTKKIDICEKIKFNNTQVEKNQGKEYTLIGIISEIKIENNKSKYISFIKKKNENENIWILCDSEQ